MNLAPVLERCAACRSPFAEQINQRMANGQPDTKVSDWLKENNAYISRITLGGHRRNHLTNEYQTAKAAVIKKFKKNQEKLKADGDLAALVKNHVISMVEAGELIPTLSEGLRAQEMIDRRVEKSADRELSVTLAGILGGGPVVNMIEMEAEEITDGQDASLDA
jgi:glutaredoxin 2